MYSFCSWVIFHCVYVPQLSYPFICQWTSRLLPYPSYCKQCCNEQWGTCISFKFWFPWHVCPAVGFLGGMAVLFPGFEGIFTLFSIVENVCIVEECSHSYQQCNSSRSFIVSGLTFRSLIHFEFIFVYGVRKCSSLILLQVVGQFSQHHLLKRLSFLHCIFLPPLSKIRCP